MQSAVLSTHGKSICPSICLSHVSAVTKRIKLKSQGKGRFVWKLGLLVAL